MVSIRWPVVPKSVSQNRVCFPYYGKQCMFWDAMFGKMGKRLETYDANVDWSMN
mgnify:CR=1 FL=1